MQPIACIRGVKLILNGAKSAYDTEVELDPEVLEEAYPLNKGNDYKRLLSRTLQTCIMMYCCKTQPSNVEEVKISFTTYATVPFTIQNVMQ